MTRDVVDERIGSLKKMYAEKAQELQIITGAIKESEMYLAYIDRPMSTCEGLADQLERMLAAANNAVERGDAVADKQAVEPQQ
jgi:hypothetical protein